MSGRVEDQRVSVTAFIIASGLLIAFLFIYLWRDSWMIHLITRYPDEIRAAFFMNRALLLGIWVTATWAFIAFAQDIALSIFEARRGHRVPFLVTLLFRFTVVLFTTSAVLVTVFDVSPVTVGLIFAAGVALGVLFLRNVFSELLAGLSISMDSQIGIGSRLELADGTRGKLQAMNWRSVVLRQDDGGLVVVPNAMFANAVLRNLDLIGDRSQVEFLLTLDFSLPIERATRVLTAAVMAASREAGMVTDPPPTACVKAPGRFGVEYSVSFAYHAEQIHEGAARTIVLRHIMKHLRETGLSIALPKQNVFVGEARMLAREWEDVADRQVLIGELNLFRSLEPEELRLVASEALVHRIAAGEQVIREGDTSTSMFGLAEGLLEVSVGNGKKVIVGTLEPGSFFGEMSMLAGEPRSATVTALVDSVVFEITREGFRDVLLNRMEVAESISRLIAERQLANSEALQRATTEERDQAISSASESLLSKIRSAFSLFSRGAEER